MIDPAEFDRLAELTLAEFSVHRGERFELTHPGGRIDLELIEVDAIEPRREAAPRHPFSLVFRGPDDPRLAQGIHRLRHPALGWLPLFLVPVGERDGARLYEAVFQ